MRLRIASTLWALCLTILALPLGAGAQVAPRDPDAGWPVWMREYKKENPEAWTFERAWKNRAIEARRQLRDPSRAMRIGAGGVTGTFQVPVFAVSFANTVAEPWPVSELQEGLFTWNNSSLTDFYSEVSGRRVQVYGSVRGWFQLARDDTWYEGDSAGTNPFTAHVGELIRDTIAHWDSQVDFGQYDNDGPDGIPNSGDDDGYVDFVAFVHPETGAECGGGSTSIWSHRWRYSAWGASGGVPYVTGDVSASGGQILVDDYTIQPALACNGTDRIEIGVFCHEFGHAFGLPDLYDTNGGGAGLGHWCLMASGNWNSPDSPAHMSAWTKAELGWVDVVDVDWQGTTLTIDPVQESGTVYRLPTREDRWRRRDQCAVSGDWSMGVGLDATASAARGWPAASGYGNGWIETVARDFEYDGSGPVRLEFDYRVHTEAGFDFVFLFVEQDGEETTLAVYDGERTGSGSFELDADYLEPGAFRIGFRLRTDVGWSNEDGKYVTPCTAFAFDDVSVTGGGIDYAADFEENRQGWYQPRNEKDNPLTECWLVENRQAIGFDEALHGEGLVVYHVDDDVMASSLKNTGGSTGATTRGIVIEEADGRFDLIRPTGNRGDAGDVWAPTGAASVFGLNTVPGSLNNSGQMTATRVEVLSVSGGVIQARMWAGDFAPELSVVEPDTIGDAMTRLEIRGSGLQPGLQVGLYRQLSPVIWATRIEWVDEDLAYAEFEGEDVRPGLFDLLVENPDGQTAVRAGGVFRGGLPTDTPPDPRTPARFALQQNFPNPFNPVTTIRFEVPVASSVELAVFDLRGRRIATLHRGPIDAGFHDVRWEGRDDQGRAVASGLYFARLTGPGFSDARKMMLAR